MEAITIEARDIIDIPTVIMAMADTTARTHTGIGFTAITANAADRITFQEKCVPSAEHELLRAKGVAAVSLTAAIPHCEGSLVFASTPVIY
jgi:hypothetical protein